MPIIEVSHLTKEYRLGAMQGLKQTLLNTGARLIGKHVPEPPPLAGFADNLHLGQTVTDPNGDISDINGAILSVGHLVTGGWRGGFPLLQRGSEGEYAASEARRTDEISPTFLYDESRISDARRSPLTRGEGMGRGNRSRPGTRSLSDLSDRSEPGRRARTVLHDFEAHSGPMQRESGQKWTALPTGAVDQPQVRQAPRLSWARGHPVMDGYIRERTAAEAIKRVPLRRRSEHVAEL